MIDIKINGGRHYGDKEPDSIDVLIEQLKARTLDPRFERHYADRFITTITDKNGEPTGTIRFWGDFAETPHAFDLRTDEQPLIEQLSNLIKTNIQSDAYQQARRAAGIKG
jgi:hypothetical protein